MANKTSNSLPNRISETFRNRTIFISGATGFIGKVLVEKLLRCTEVKKIFVLIRPKKGLTPQERLNTIFDNVLFNLVKEERPNCFSKCIAINGDVGEVNLGISDADRKILQNETEFIIHSAASTRFDDTIHRAVILNTRGTKYMLDLAKECKNLKIFVHVSTAYAFPNETVLYEKPYDPPANPHDVLNALKWIKEDTMKKFDKEILGDIPNTYTFSKALAEALVVEEFDNLPVVICRPALVIPTWKSPLPGWCNNLQGPLGIMVGAGKGVIRTMYMEGSSYASFIPADSCINGIMIQIWSLVGMKNKQYRIVNLCVPKEYIRITWSEVLRIGRDIIYNEVPFNNILWYPGGDITNSRLVFNFKFLFYQLIPALFIDLLLFILGYKPILYNIQMRIRKGQDMFDYYTTKKWECDTAAHFETIDLIKKHELEVYKIDPEGLDIREYFLNALMATRRYILKETDDMIPRAKSTMKIMYIVDWIVSILFYLGLFYLFCKIIF